MASTKKIISEQVLFRLYGGQIDTAAPVQQEDIWKALEQIINNTFRLQQFNATLPSGEIIPESASIATYENIAVVSYYNCSRAILPITPISLPKNIGIFDIKTAYSLGGQVPQINFIPMQRGQNALLKSDLLLNSLLNQVGYEPSNKFITFTKDITLLGITKVDMDLIVFDMALYGIDDVLPIPASFEADIVNQLVQQFNPVQAENGQVNLLTTAGQNK